MHWTEFPERIETFGDLVSILETLDRDNARNVIHFESCAKETPESAYSVEFNGPTYYFAPRADRIPGLERLLDRLEREHCSDLSLSLLRELRGRVSAALRIDRAAVNALTVTEVADALDATDRAATPATAATLHPADPNGDRSSNPPPPTTSDNSPGHAPTGTTPGIHLAPPVEKANSSTESRYTLGRLIQWLEGVEQHREFHRLNQQEQLRRNPVREVIDLVFASARRWQLDETQMPGIGRIELLCDLEPGEAGINAAKVRRLRAKICQQQHWQAQHADELTLDQAADLLEGIQHVSLADQNHAQQDMIHHGLATLDTIQIGAGRSEVVQITGLSCKVVAGTMPTACPDANPVLPPSMLPLAERAIRRLYSLPKGTTVHWVGHDAGIRSHCRCHPDAPFTAPFDQSRWASVPGAELTESASPVGGPRPGAADTPGDDAVLALDGGVYTIRWRGVSGSLPNNLAELRNLAQLVARPGQVIPWAVLLGGNAVPRDRRTTQLAYDEEARRQYHEEAARLRREVEEAETDTEREDSQQRLDELLACIRSMTATGGQPRDLNNEADRHRPKIHGRLSTVYERMRKADPPLGELANHLEQSISATPEGYIFDPPSPAPTWQTEFPKK